MIKKHSPLLTSDGFLYGFGLFETMLCRNGNVVALNEHLDRLYRSAKIINLKITQGRSRLEKEIQKQIKHKKLADLDYAYVRLNVWKEGPGSNFNVLAKKYTPPSASQYKQGFRVMVSSWRINENSPLSGVKSLNYLLNILAYDEAKRKGFDEAIFVNTRGLVAEGSRSNIFVVKKGELLTPSLNCGILPGITRKIVINLAKKNELKVKEAHLTLKDLKTAEEAFLTNSLIQIMPLQRINNIFLNQSKSFPVTNELIELYEKMLR